MSETQLLFPAAPCLGPLILLLGKIPLLSHPMLVNEYVSHAHDWVFPACSLLNVGTHGQCIVTDCAGWLLGCTVLSFLATDL